MGHRSLLISRVGVTLVASAFVAFVVSVLEVPRMRLMSPHASSQKNAEALGATVPHVTYKKDMVEGYGKIPLSFEVNRGQFNRNVEFATRGPGTALFLSSG